MTRWEPEDLVNNKVKYFVEMFLNLIEAIKICSELGVSVNFKFN